MAHHLPHEHGNISGRNLLFATVLNFAITIAEVIGGLISNSLALLSDALHNLGDGIAVLLAYIANRIGKRESNERKTFGYKRIEILAAFLNSIVLVVISIFLVIEAIKRFYDPEPIKGLIMFIVATIGLAANLVAVLILRKDAKFNINVRSAYLHLLGDTMSSVAVIIGGLLIYLFNIYWIDPLITILISIYILKETWSILKESVDILMQSTPRNLDVQSIKEDIEQIEGVENIHHVHIWSLSDLQVHFECHVDLNKDMEISKTEIIRSKIEDLLRENYKINHVTTQFEYNAFDSKEVISR